MTGTRTMPINAEIESSFENSKNLNVEGGTCLARSHVTAIPRFVFKQLHCFQTKALQPQLTRAEPLKGGLKPYS